MNVEKENIEINKKLLVKWFENGCKEKSDFKIGTEHEKFVYSNEDMSPVGYEGNSGIKKILQNLKVFGWEELQENGNIIGLKKNNQSITLEPGGQLELSGAPLHSIHQTCYEVNDHLTQIKKIGKKLGVSFLGLGARIDGKLAPDLWMPKARYGIMKKYMPAVGKQGLEMMADTCTIQVNLDFSSEKDMIRKTRVAFKLQPFVTAMFANSPLKNMKKSNFISRRAAIWLDVDKERCGIPSIIFDEGFGFEMWVDYALKVPMYFIRRNGNYLDFSGNSFENFMNGSSNDFNGHKPTMQDWEDHLSTIFTEVRIKRFLEMRGADAGPWKNLCALPALWVGLLYDNAALEEAESLSSEISYNSLMDMYSNVPIYGYNTKVNGRLVSDYSKEILQISMKGLKNRNILDASANDESGYLKDLVFEVMRKKNPANSILAIYNKNKLDHKREIYDFFSY